jgi:hypothetical protein
LPSAVVDCLVSGKEPTQFPHGTEAHMNVSAVGQHLSPQMVTQAAVQAAGNDGDGRTGAAALNDGDGAAKAAARHLVAPQAAAAAPAPVPMPHKVDVKA